MTKERILQELRRNARKSFAKLSRENNIPVTTIFETYDDLRKNLITKHTSLIDFRKLGFGQRNILLIKAKSEELKEFLTEHQNVNNIHKVKEYNYSCETIFKNMKEYYDFLDQLEELRPTEIKRYEIIEELKREEFQPKF